MRCCIAGALATLIWAGAVQGQQTGAVALTVRVTAEGTPLEDAQVIAGTIGRQTDSLGTATLRLPAGAHDVIVRRLGFAERDLRITLVRDTTIDVALEQEAVEEEAIIVSSTRSDRRIEDEPVRVEVIAREEIEEKLMMTPGDISMMLNETAGLRVQPTAPALGGASVRIQGLRGRYTQILSDGLPLHGGQTGALGPLQIPPMDLAQVEVIKGAASALYGASALGGVVNLVSRRPGDETERELLLNQSTLGGTDAIFWTSSPVSEQWGYTLLASAHRQSAADVDEDGWADLPSFRRGMARPRVFWNNGRGTTALLTVGAMVEARQGGMLDGDTTPGGTVFEESLDTRRLDAGFIGRTLLGPATLLSVRASAATQDHDHGFGGSLERDDHTTTFAEAAVSRAAERGSWVAGVALQHEAYDARDVAGFDYTHTVPGVFGQSELSPWRWLKLAVTARYDHHSEYGGFLNYRQSALIHPGAGFTIRASAGNGYFAPTPWVEEVEAVGLRHLAPLEDLQAEVASSGSLDVGRVFGPLELNATWFASSIQHPVFVAEATDSLPMLLFNGAGSVRTSGAELLARYHVEGLHVTATYVYTQSKYHPFLIGEESHEPLIPDHTAGIVAAWEQEGRGRIGAELYYTGKQRLEDNPYRNESEPYVIVGFLAERRFGAVRAFLNAENIFDTRQTRHDSLLLPAQAPDGRWITDVWAPLEGRSFNAGIRWQM